MKTNIAIDIHHQSHICSGVKMWKFTSNFLNIKNVWHMKGMNIPSEKMPSYKHGDVRNRVFVMLQRLNMNELATTIYLVNRMS